MHGHELDGLAVVGEIDPGAVAQAAIAADVERLEVGLARDGEPTLDREASVLLAVQRPLGTVIDVNVIDLGIHHPAEGLFTIDLLDGEDVGVEEPHIAAHPVIIRGGTCDRGV
jgi:hypothetical protein